MRVLIVDDSELALNVLSDVLGDAGYEVETAPDGVAGLQRIREGFCRLVISDWEMPLMSGTELWKRYLGWLERHVPLAHANLAGPASDPQIAEVERATGQALPEAVKEVWRLNDGQKETMIAPYKNLKRLAMIGYASGGLFTIMIFMAWFGIPILIASWLLWRAKAWRSPNLTRGARRRYSSGRGRTKPPSMRRFEAVT